MGRPKRFVKCEVRKLKTRGSLVTISLHKRAAPESRNAYCVTLSPAKETTMGMPCVTTQKRLHEREGMTLPIQIPPPPPTTRQRLNSPLPGIKCCQLPEISARGKKAGWKPTCRLLCLLQSWHNKDNNNNSNKRTRLICKTI